MRNQQNVKVRVNSSFETICPFPVGYVYMSSNSTSPADIYGGTWASISGGRYMRAASVWGNGGSNIITVSQMPAHSHQQRYFYVRDKGGWSAPINGNAVPQVASNVTTTPFATNATLDTTNSAGGGQHSILRTKTFGRGTELPREGDASCVTFNKFESALRAASRKFAHSRLVLSICQPIQQVQQALTVVHGHLSEMVRSCGQAVRGILQAEQAQTRIITGCRSARKMVFRVYRLLVLAAGQMEQHILCVRQRLLTVFLRKILILVQVVETQQNQPLIAKPSQRFRLTAPVIVGTAQPSYIGGVC